MAYTALPTNNGTEWLQQISPSLVAVSCEKDPPAASLYLPALIRLVNLRRPGKP